MKKTTGILAFLFFALTSSPAQQPYFQNYFLLRKNESVVVNTIFQDRSGFIWSGTNKGLFKFDGIKFQRFGLKDSLQGSVTAIAQDSTGRIWIGQHNGVIAILENNILHKWETPEGNANQEISRILFDRNGVLWYSTLGDGLWYFRNNRAYRIDEANGMPDIFVYDIAVDRSGAVWAGTDGGAAVITLKDTASIRVLNYRHGLPDNIIKKIRITPDDQVWMVTDNSGVISYDPAKNQYHLLSSGGWRHGPITDFVHDGDKVWITAPQTGLVLIDTPSGTEQLFNAKETPGILSLSTLIRDREGNLWLGSRTGLLRTPGDKIEYIGTRVLAHENSVVAVATGADGVLWWASEYGLFRRTVDKEGQEKTERQLTHTPFEQYTITSLYVDAAGLLWVGFYGEGALRINPKTGARRHYNNELRNGNVLNISGKGNVIWLSTLEGATSITNNGDKEAIRSYSSKDGLGSDYIYQTFVDSRNRVWFATDGKGADMMDETGIHHFQKGLNSKIVYGFAEDGQHTLWVNVAVDGLYSLNGDHFSALGQGKSLRENSISGIAADRQGNIIVMHDQGIDLYDVKTKKVRFFGDESGLRDKLPNLNATASDISGTVYFGTSQSIVVYAATNDSLSNEPVPLIDGVKVMDKDVGTMTALTLSHNRNYITINYIGLWYQDPENLYFQTRLDQYDRDWITSRDHSVTYSSLQPGNYTFHLRVSNTGDFTNAKEVTISIVVQPPFWNTAWFVGIVSLALIFLTYGYVRYRERSLHENNRILEMKITERTLEIQRKTEEIQAQNEEIHSQAEEIKGINENLELLVKERTLELVKKNKALEEYAFITAHNLRAPVASVLGLINLASKLELDEESKVLVEHLQTSAEKLDLIVRSITQAIEKGE